MNLKQIRDFITSSTDYKPTNTEYRDWLNSTINQAYSEVYTSHYWTFDKAEAKIPIYATYGPEQADQDLRARGVETTPGERVLVVEPGNRYVESWPDTPLYALQENPWAWVGQSLRISNIEYTIQWIYAPVENRTRIYLEEPVTDITSGVQGTEYPFHVTDWEFIARKVWLPHDVSEVTAATIRRTPYNRSNAVHRNLTLITDTYERGLHLDLLDQGEPQHLIINQPKWVPPAGKCTFIRDAEVGIELDTGTYEFAWCYTGEGETWGPLSEPAEITVTEEDTNQTIMLRAVQADGTSLGYSDTDLAGFGTDRINPPSTRSYPITWWINRNVDRSTGRRLGAPEWIQVVYGTTVLPSQIPSVVSESFARDPWYSPWQDLVIRNSSFLVTNTNRRAYLDRSGLIQSANTYPVLSGGQYIPPTPNILPNEPTSGGPTTIPTLATPITAPSRQEVISLAYRKLPLPLTTDTSSPQMPAEFHQVIADLAMYNICMFGNDSNKATIYHQRYLAGIDRLQRRYAVNHGTLFMKKPIGGTDKWGSVWAATVQSYLGRNR